MEELLKSLSPDKLVMVTAGLIYIGRQAVEWTLKWVLKRNDKLEELTVAVKDLSFKLEHFSVRLISTEGKLDKHDEVRNLVWKLERDVQFAHDKIRDLKDELKDDQ